MGTTPSSYHWWSRCLTTMTTQPTYHWQSIGLTTTGTTPSSYHWQSRCLTAMTTPPTYHWRSRCLTTMTPPTYHWQSRCLTTMTTPPTYHWQSRCLAATARKGYSCWILLRQIPRHARHSPVAPEAWRNQASRNHQVSSCHTWLSPPHPGVLKGYSRRADGSSAGNGRRWTALMCWILRSHLRRLAMYMVLSFWRCSRWLCPGHKLGYSPADPKIQKQKQVLDGESSESLTRTKHFPGSTHTIPLLIRVKMKLSGHPGWGWEWVEGASAEEHLIGHPEVNGSVPATAMRETRVCIKTMCWLAIQVPCPCVYMHALKESCQRSCSPRPEFDGLWKTHSHCTRVPKGP